MNLSQALSAVGKHYVPGVVKYYSQLSPDPWQLSHDELEQVALLDEHKLISTACERFVSRCIQLIDQFKENGLFTTKVSIADAFAIGDEARVKAIESVKSRSCYQCESKDGIQIESYGDNKLEVRVVCRHCKNAVRNAS